MSNPIRQPIAVFWYVAKHLKNPCKTFEESLQNIWRHMKTIQLWRVHVHVPMYVPRCASARQCIVWVCVCVCVCAWEKYFSIEPKRALHVLFSLTRNHHPKRLTTCIHGFIYIYEICKNPSKLIRVPQPFLPPHVETSWWQSDLQKLSVAPWFSRLNISVNWNSTKMKSVVF